MHKKLYAIYDALTMLISPALEGVLDALEVRGAKRMRRPHERAVGARRRRERRESAQAEPLRGRSRDASRGVTVAQARSV